MVAQVNLSDVHMVARPGQCVQDSTARLVIAEASQYRGMRRIIGLKRRRRRAFERSIQRMVAIQRARQVDIGCGNVASGQNVANGVRRFSLELRR